MKIISPQKVWSCLFHEVANLLNRPFQVNPFSYLKTSPSSGQVNHQVLKKESATPEQDDFLVKVRQVIERHLDDPDLTVSRLCRELGLSQPQLYRKLKARSGYSPIQFIRSIRLACAQQLLQDPELGIAEVAYDVGFSSPGYFSRLFRRTFAMSPSEYRNQTISASVTEQS